MRMRWLALRLWGQGWQGTWQETLQAGWSADCLVVGDVQSEITLLMPESLSVCMELYSLCPLSP